MGTRVAQGAGQDEKPSSETVAIGWNDNQKVTPFRRNADAKKQLNIGLSTEVTVV